MPLLGRQRDDAVLGKRLEPLWFRRMGRREKFHTAWRKSRSASNVRRGEQRATGLWRIVHDERPITSRSEPLELPFFPAAEAMFRIDRQQRHALIALSFEKGSQEGRKIGT